MTPEVTNTQSAPTSPTYKFISQQIQYKTSQPQCHNINWYASEAWITDGWDKLTVNHSGKSKFGLALTSTFDL